MTHSQRRRTLAWRGATRNTRKDEGAAARTLVVVILMGIVVGPDLLAAAKIVASSICSGADRAAAISVAAAGRATGLTWGERRWGG